MRLFILLISLIAILNNVSAFSGVDISQESTVEDFQCMKGKGFDFAIIRGYCSTGQIDPNVVDSIANARAAGIEYVDTYLFPCFKCGNGEGQGESLVKYLNSRSANYGMVWIDVEGAGEYWGNNQADNQAFFESVVSGLKSAGAHIGVYSSYNSWTGIMGTSYSGGSEFSLWYPHYDANPSFSDFQTYGGWSKPSIKQYDDTGSGCGVGYDLNWYPN